MKRIRAMKIREVIFVYVCITMSAHAQPAVATFGNGCFWCTEAVFENLEGVSSVVSGYSGGKHANPSYQEVSTGRSGHAEAAQITYDPKVISYSKLLEVFWSTHDPTTRNRQGNDVGPQYRSVVFYHDEEQQKLAAGYKQKLEDAKIYENPIVTEISAFKAFYKADEAHQDYYNRNKNKPYCKFVIQPKLEKFKKVFKEDLKKGS